jgi:hypothetical protein
MPLFTEEGCDLVARIPAIEILDELPGLLLLTYLEISNIVLPAVTSTGLVTAAFV